jgi:hypothetical protein
MMVILCRRIIFARGLDPAAIFGPLSEVLPSRSEMGLGTRYTSHLHERVGTTIKAEVFVAHGLFASNG